MPSAVVLISSEKISLSIAKNFQELSFALQVDAWFGQQSKDQINFLNASS